MRLPLTRDFPCSIRVPGTESAFKLGGQARLVALVAMAVGIGQYRRGVSQSIRELEWKQADMARTLINGMMNDEGWQAMTKLDWEEGRDYESSPGTKIHILPRDVPFGNRSVLATHRAEVHGDTTIHHRQI